MKKIFDHLKFIKRLTGFSPRQLQGEAKTAGLLMDYLDKRGIPYQAQKFSLKIPRTKKAVLKIDGRPAPCDGVSMVSGEIKNGQYKVSNSLALPDKNVSPDNFYISFNPECPVISNNNYYFAPTLAVAPKTLKKILKAKNVQGKVEVEAIRHKAVNILIGNRKNPRTVCLAHYDSIKKGAIDNASGISAIIGAIDSAPEILEQALFVLSGSTELSYEKPTYYGYGYRMFEKKHYRQLDGAEKIIAIDCVGYGKTQIITDKEMIKLGSPIENFDKWYRKIIIIAGDLDFLMTLYHSEIDDGRYLKEKFLRRDADLLVKKIIS